MPVENKTEKHILSAIGHGTSTTSKMRGQAKKQLDKYFAPFKDPGWFYTKTKKKR